MKTLLVLAMLGGMQKVAADEFTIPADQRHEVPFTVAQKARLTGDYSTEPKTEVQIYLVSESTYQSWIKSDGPLGYSLYRTDVAPSGRVDVVVDPGKYYLLFVNPSKASVTMKTNLSIAGERLRIH
jgi:hypothetical protein